jgi:hypothetical protein
LTKTELTHIIREIVAEEIRTELSIAIAEVFSNFMGQKQIVTEAVKPPEKPNFRQSLKELFDETPIMSKPKQFPRKFTKDPILNEVLSQTRPFTPQERMGSPSGMAAMMAAAQAGVSLPGSAASIAMEPMSEEPSFLKGVPDIRNMIPSGAPVATSISQPELLNDNHVPLAELPEGVSVMDMKPAIAQAAPSVAKALTRNYSETMKLIDKKRGKI